MTDRTTTMALEIAAELVRKENAGSRYLINPARIGEVAATIINSLREKLSVQASVCGGELGMDK